MTSHIATALVAFALGWALTVQALGGTPEKQDSEQLTPVEIQAL